MFMVLVLVFLTACNNNNSFEEDTGRYYVKYDNKFLTYRFNVTKPTPCNTLTHDVITMESYPVQVQVLVTIEPYDGICAQVISEETLEGSVIIDHKPGSFSVKVDNEEVYSTDLNN